ncbi:hypothetical protein PAI11_05190 [Patulibacter medicamentivorans]|uniref:Uncharacterized protein n=1 Tax=Patulibacter medicamentivorans TaxID=1097667 RepID=H0E159_9ACTN|nr:hypothetical protein [Patulibacter medicamentivorans]EHN12579.1 hypothetical protein PAI11_05190 [Patulibacter medicamentivorans]
MTEPSASARTGSVLPAAICVGVVVAIALLGNVGVVGSLESSLTI